MATTVPDVPAVDVRPQSVVLRNDEGHRLPLDVRRWHEEPSAVEERLLAGLAGPVLDVGCGPGRIVVGLGRLGIPALGVDPAPGAVELAQRRGASILQRSVFDRLPGQGRWQTLLLLDGNLGIGGDPARLLRRCRELTARSGTVVAEVEGPGARTQRHRARLERGAGHGSWFRWAVVGVDGIGSLAMAAGLIVGRLQHDRAEDRWFAHLVSPDGGGHGGQ